MKTLKRELSVPIQGSYKKLIQAGFIDAAKMLKKQEWAKKNGMVFVPNETVQNYNDYLQDEELEFDFKDLEDYRPTNEIIPISEIEKVNKINKKGWFDKILVTSVRRLRDPIVIGIIDDDEHCKEHSDRSLIQADNDYAIHYDWYIIAAWK